MHGSFSHIKHETFIDAPGFSAWNIAQQSEMLYFFAVKETQLSVFLIVVKSFGLHKNSHQDR